MANFETILSHQDVNIVRVIKIALKAHGFHPLDEGLAGPLGYPGVSSPKGMDINVPSQEAEDARLLAGALLKEMLT